MEKNQKNLLEISDLTVRYNTDDAVVHAVNDFNLNLVRGEARGLVGETGAGKTTLALSILRLLPERVGEIKFTDTGKKRIVEGGCCRSGWVRSRAAPSSMTDRNF